MGEVFRAVHVERNLPVAIKILNARRARDPEFRSALRQEIRAVARLHHPGLIMVFDCGEVSTDVAEASGQRFIPGSSWLAMELASHSLQELDRDVLDWWHVRNILVRILDALSHSHARGVVHRDLKPANVLFVDGPDGRQLKLTDFGLAHALDDPRESDFLARKISGTPRFMSPEQITGQWRDQGPWTDLYALGCMSYWLVDGEPPFNGESTDEILESHLSEPLPPLHASFDLPAGFGVWLGRLLAKNASDRFQRAADAARALFALGDPAGKERITDPPPLRFKSPLDESFLSLDDGSDMGMTEIISDVMSAPSVPELRALERPSRKPRRAAPPEVFHIPLSWHRKEPPPLSADLVGVGLGLFGLRQIPFVGRHNERDRVWESLRQVARTGRPQTILLRGPTGTGKTRLAAWISERAHELGTATPLRATHSPMGGRQDGLGAMFADHLRCNGLDREEVLERVRHSLHDRNLDPDALHDCLAITEIITPAIVADYREEDARIRFRSPQERHAVILRFLHRTSHGRPLILFLDDLQWGNDTLNTLEYLINATTEQRMPLLIIGTVQTDALVDRPVARQKLKELANHEQTTNLTIGPLPPDEHRMLINRMLSLEEELVEQVADRTGGNPLYAVQLVGDWVERRVLELGHNGFRLRRGEKAPLPDGLQAVFRDRLTKLVQQDLDAAPTNALLALEVAAVLGTDVQRREWSSICARRSLRLPLLVLDSMVANDLVVLSAGGWSFHHQAFRETLVHTAEKNGRLQEHHLSCARALPLLYTEDHPGLALRVSRHLIAAGFLEEAIEPQLRAASQSCTACDFEQAHAQFELYQDLLDQLGASTDDPRRARGWIKRAETLIRQDELAPADQLLERAENTARTHNRPDLLAETLAQRATVATRRGHLPQGLTFIEEARTLYQQLGDTHGRAQAYLIRANLHYWGGEYFDSEKAYNRAHTLFSRIDASLDLARVDKALGALYTITEETERAHAKLENARSVFEEHGDLRGVANCLNNLGEIHRLQERYDEAEAAYQKSHDIDRRLGLEEDIVILINLGMVRLAQNRVEDAAPMFRRVLELTSKSQRRGYLGFAHVANLPVVAHFREWDKWEYHLNEAHRLLKATGFVEPDIAVLARDAGERALQAGEPTRGREALLLARAQWLYMGRQDRAAEIDGIIPEA